MHSHRVLLLHRGGPVSYTHLDVYKRQQLAPDEVLVYCAKGETLDGEIQIQDTSCKIKENLSEEVIPMGMGTLLTDAYCIVAVSYTHLDVYKRQVQRWG